MAIKEAVNLTPKWFRAPQGDADDRVRGILTQLGYRMAFWNHDTFDWESNTDPNWDLSWIPGNFSMWVQNTTATTGFASLEHDAFDKPSSMAETAMDIVVKAKFNPQSVAVCSDDKQPYVENVTLPPSNIKGQENAPGTGTGTSKAPKSNGDGSQPAVISQSGSIAVEKNLLLGTACGLIMMILGFVGTI